ncbi:hypothetical protein RJ639_043780 [Escallonia herrerae]|uniref:TCP domain-containing protein n=1 Tax=Escallonia herrerae TaxID=1293975 RepID=A0AA88WEJ9_9ASTE|nr:hypothetical protein RJ639_043780 [Escallonia herrerae]
MANTKYLVKWLPISRGGFEVVFGFGVRFSWWSDNDRLGYDRPSKAVDWLINKAKNVIAKLDELPE